MKAPGFIIHAAGSLGNQADLGKRPYRLHCRFSLEADASLVYLTKAKLAAAEQFVRDLQVRGWDYVERFGFRMTGPFPHIVPVTICAPRLPPAREMLAEVLKGERFLPTGRETLAHAVPGIRGVEYVDYDLSGVFVHRTLLVERPDPHEERVKS